MKILRFDGGRTGLIFAEHKHDPSVLDLAATLSKSPHLGTDISAAVLASLGPYGTDSWQGMIEKWELLGPELTKLTEQANSDPASVDAKALSQVILEPPLISPTHRVFVGGANFGEHSAAAVGAGKAPFDPIRNKAAGEPPSANTILQGTIVASGPIQRPLGVLKLDYEAELAAIIGSGGHDIDPDSLKVWGYAPFNDFSVRDVHFGLGRPHDKGPFSLPIQKNFERGNAFGPWIVVDELDDSGLHVR